MIAARPRVGLVGAGLLGGAAVALGQSSPPSDLVIDSPPTEWVAAHSPHGFDITRDGKVWINVAPIGRADDYAILANDLYKWRGSSNPVVWMRGYHRRNAKARHRESKLLISFNCIHDQMWVQRRLYYSADGTVMASEGPFAGDPVVPGSVGEEWRDAACIK